MRLSRRIRLRPPAWRPSRDEEAWETPGRYRPRAVPHAGAAPESVDPPHRREVSPVSSEEGIGRTAP